jgi:hypothetical protein
MTAVFFPGLQPRFLNGFQNYDYTCFNLVTAGFEISRPDSYRDREKCLPQNKRTLYIIV